MTAPIRKIAAVLLLVLILAPMSYTFIFRAKQQAIHHSMKERLEEKMLHTIIVAANNIHWVRPGKEIMTEGRMFDIKQTTPLPDGTVQFKGLFDDEETLLTRQLQQKQQEDNSKGNKQIVQLFQLMQALPESAPEKSSDQISHAGFQPAFDMALLPSPCKNILTPPPQF